MTRRTRLWLLASSMLVIFIAVFAVLKLPAREPVDGPVGGTKPRRPGQVDASVPEEAPPERLTILVIGTDARPGDPGRTDTIILATVDTGTGEIHLLSIPRDTWVFIDNHGWDKVNAAYAVAPDDARPQTTMQVVSDLLQVPIDHYVVVHMGGFKDVVDLLGGVDMYIEHDMYYVDPMDTPPLVIDFEAGQHRLDGEDALKYVRYRSDDRGDWGRMERQQQFLKALAKEALQLKHITRARSLGEAIVAAVDTDLTALDFGRLALSYRKFNLDELKSQIVGGFDQWIGGIYFLEPNLADARTLAHRQVYGKEPSAQVLEEAAIDFAASRSVIESEIARFAALAAEEEAAARAECDDLDDGSGEGAGDGTSDGPDLGWDGVENGDGVRNCGSPGDGDDSGDESDEGEPGGSGDESGDRPGDGSGASDGHGSGDSAGAHGSDGSGDGFGDADEGDDDTVKPPGSTVGGTGGG